MAQLLQPEGVPRDWREVQTEQRLKGGINEQQLRTAQAVAAYHHEKYLLQTR